MIVTKIKGTEKKLRKLSKTALMTFDLHHIHIIGRFGQGQHTLMTSRSQSQGHKGQILSPPPPPIFRPSTADKYASCFSTTLTSLVTLNFYLRSPKYPWPHVLTLDRTFPLNLTLKKVFVCVPVSNHFDDLELGIQVQY